MYVGSNVSLGFSLWHFTDNTQLKLYMILENCVLNMFILALREIAVLEKPKEYDFPSNTIMLYNL